MGQKLAAFIGFLVIVGIGYLLSNNKKHIDWKTFFWGIGLQFAFAIMVLKGEDIKIGFAGILPDSIAKAVTGLVVVMVLAYFAVAYLMKNKDENMENMLKPTKWVVGIASLIVILRWNFLETFFNGARGAVEKLMEFSSEGATFVFGSLATDAKPVGMVFAFKVLPTIIFIASLFAVLYYLGVMQVIVAFAAKLMAKVMNTSGAESTSVAASIFMGQTEAPLTIRPFLSDMTKSELMTMMTAGMAHVSGSIMVAYVMIAHVDIKHLLTAVIMTAPGAIFMSKLIVPEVDQPKTSASVKVEVEIHDVNIIDAAARGASEGAQLAFNVAGMLVAFISIVAMINGCIGAVDKYFESTPSLMIIGKYFPSSLQQFLGWLFSPLAFVMGVPWKDAPAVGNLMGLRMVLNEFVAFLQLGPMKETLDPRSFTICTYALCGFANFSSIAIQVGGIGALAPERRHDLAKTGLKAMIAGTLANFLTATIAGMLL
ncbi:MAG: NupC/NupG family nucleoside CNT transporter [Firmicutes bacterium]|nr:NupC/NupG family nucleoside CNT transporter [Bacillota bacterium]